MADARALLLTLRDALAPLIENVLKSEASESGRDWIEAENSRREEKGNLRPLRIREDGSYWDPMDLLQTIKGERWYLLRSIFIPQGKRFTEHEERTAYNLARGRIDEILNGRNNWAHFNNEQQDHLARTCALLLESAGLNEQAKLAAPRARESSSGAEPLIERADSSHAIRLVRDEFRGLDLDEPPGIERISPGERIRVEIDLAKLAVGGWRYGVVLVVDPAEVSCLMPSARIAPNRELLTAVVTIPDPNVTAHALRFKGTLGRHVILFLVTRQILPATIYTALASPQPRSFLNRIAGALRNIKESDWHLIKLEFDVG